MAAEPEVLAAYNAAINFRFMPTYKEIWESSGDVVSTRSVESCLMKAAAAKLLFTEGEPLS